ncbi:MAG: hypothetical protein IIZ78_06410 [Clostridiales bacterium]|nr:hypothetical protein [Clostridiales bacterium]
MTNDKMLRLDVVTIATFAMFSLLSGAEVCTMPTELEEVKKRYDDIVKLLLEDEDRPLVYSDESYFPSYPADKWPWATSEEDYKEFLRNTIVTGVAADNDREVHCYTMTALLSNKAIEEKYRLSRVKLKLLSEALLPF